MKLPKPWRTFHVPIYGGEVFVYKDQNTFNEAVAAHKLSVSKEPLGGRCLSLDAKSGAVRYLVGWFNGYVPSLVHELGHLTLFVLERAGINPRDSSGETYCYLLAQLCVEVDLHKLKHTIK